MSDAGTRRAEKLRVGLLEHHAPHLICQPDSHLVIEGYPRSANTFSVDMLNVLTADGQRLLMGHHTHKVANLRLAEIYDVPRLVLIRQPEDAILSFMIFSGKPVATCLVKYIKFYSAVLTLEKPFQVAPFATVVTDFTRIVENLNTVLATPVPVSQNLLTDVQTAQERARARAEKTHGKKSVQRVGAPSDARDKMKAQQRPEVAQVLKYHTEAASIYQKVIARGNQTDSVGML